MGSRKQERHDGAAKARRKASSEDLRRAEAKIRGAFGLLDGPELEKLNLSLKDGELVLDLTVEHRVEMGHGPGVETRVSVEATYGFHVDELLAMDEAIMARGFEQETATGCLAPDLSRLWLLEEVMAMMEAAPRAS